MPSIPPGAPGIPGLPGYPGPPGYAPLLVVVFADLLRRTRMMMYSAFAAGAPIRHTTATKTHRFICIPFR